MQFLHLVCLHRFFKYFRFSLQLFDCLKATIDDPIVYTKTGKVFRNNDDLTEKITEFKREEIKIGAKVFLNNSSVDNLEVAVENLLLTLGVDCLDNLILSFHPRRTTNITNGNGEHNGVLNGSNKEPDTPNSIDGREGVLEWGVGNVNALNELKSLWNVLEEYAQQKKICQLGIADLDTESFQELYECSKVKPTIAQINLKACCVVPPSLQEFCTKNEIQLLTHSDPEGKNFQIQIFEASRLIYFVTFCLEHVVSLERACQ